MFDFTLKRETVQYLHMMVGSSISSTPRVTIEKGNFITYPGLTSTLDQNYLLKSVTITKERTYKMRQNMRSTKVKEADLPASLLASSKMATQSILDNIQQNMIKIKCVNISVLMTKWEAFQEIQMKQGQLVHQGCLLPIQ